MLTKMQCEVDKGTCHYQDEERFPLSLDFDFRSSGYSVISSRCKVSCGFPRCTVQDVLLSHRERNFLTAGLVLVVYKVKLDRARICRLSVGRRL